MSAFPLLALDLATRTGWALLLGPEARVLSGVKQLPKGGGDLGRFLRTYRDWLTDIMVLHRPLFICSEAPLPPRQQSSNAAAMRLLGLSMVTQMVAGDYGARWYSANNQTAKKHFAGSGRADKAAMMQQCRVLWGIEPTDDNEADAIAVLDLALSKLAPAVAANRMYEGRAA